MSEFTPSTEQVRSHYVFDQSDRRDAERGVQFDRWLAEVKIEAWLTGARGGYTAGLLGNDPPENPYRTEAS